MTIKFKNMLFLNSFVMDMTNNIKNDKAIMSVKAFKIIIEIFYVLIELLNF